MKSVKVEASFIDI